MALFFKRKEPEQCECDSAEAVKIVANRIKALTKERDAFEAKLAKAVEALQDIFEKPRSADWTYAELISEMTKEARATLAALHAGGEEWPTS
jgi:hypothetical protein